MSIEDQITKNSNLTLRIEKLIEEKKKFAEIETEKNRVSQVVILLESEIRDLSHRLAQYESGQALEAQPDKVSGMDIDPNRTGTDSVSM